MKYQPAITELITEIFDNQISLFTLLFDVPEPHIKFKSPFREDNNAGCYFNLYNHKLYFIDWALQKTHLSIIDFTKLMYNLNTYDAILYLHDCINSNQDFKKNTTLLTYNQPVITNIEKKIEITPRYFNSKDKAYWGSYNIELTDLVKMENNFKFVPVSKIKIISQKEQKIIIPQSIAYAYVGTTGIKTYIPESSNYKWRNTISKNEIGISPKKRKSIIITKSVKDGIILSKLGYDYAFFQSETSFPDDDILKSKIIDRYEYINILFDNDYTGIQNAKKLCFQLKDKHSVINTKIIMLKEAKDISDYSKLFGLTKVNSLLKNQILT